MAFDLDDNFYLTGQIYGRSTDFDPSAREMMLPSIGQNDCFIVKYDADGNLWRETMTTVQNIKTSMALSVCPQPVVGTGRIRYTLDKRADVQIVLVDMLGNSVAELTHAYHDAGAYDLAFDASRFASGAYSLHVQSDGKILARQSLIILR